MVSATRTVPGGTSAPIAIYNGNTGVLVGSPLVLTSGSSYYETVNTPCVNNGNYPHHIYVSTQLHSDSSHGVLYALQIDPTNPDSPITPAWSVAFGGPSGLSIM